MPIEVPSAADVKSLPMSARIQVRDNYGKDDSELAKNIAKLSKELSADVVFHLDWSEAWEKLGTSYKDNPQDFVQQLIHIGNDLVQSIQTVIDANDAWGLSLLGKLEQAGKTQLDLYVKVDSNAKTAQPVWNPIESTITLRLPLYTDTTHLYYPGSIRDAIPTIFDGNFDDSTSDHAPASSAPSSSASQPVNEPSSNNGGNKKISSAPERFPPLSTIPQPSNLSKSTVPYWVTITTIGDSSKITGTHEPTIDLLAEYMEKWGNVTQNRTTSVKIERLKSAFGQGNVGFVVDRRTNFGPGPNEVLPLQLLQGPLGYEVTKTDGRTWVLKRSVPFF